MRTRRKQYSRQEEESTKPCESSASSTSSTTKVLHGNSRKRRRIMPKQKAQNNKGLKITLKARAKDSSCGSSSNKSKSKSSRSRKTTRTVNSDDCAHTLSMALYELIQLQHMDINDVTIMENPPNGLHRNPGTARVFLQETNLHRRVAMVKSIFKAGEALKAAMPVVEGA